MRTRTFVKPSLGDVFEHKTNHKKVEVIRVVGKSKYQQFCWITVKGDKDKTTTYGLTALNELFTKIKDT